MNKFLTVAFAAILFSTTALAKDKKVVIELPKTITVTCSDRVQPGTVVLSNPPKFSCADYDVVKRVSVLELQLVLMLESVVSYVQSVGQKNLLAGHQPR